MTDERPRVLAVVPARGGSKGIPRKNVRLMAGQPLISYALRALAAAQMVDCVVVSTDDDEIKAVARRCGAEVIDRPAELAGDAVTLDPVVYHAVEQVEAAGFLPDVVLTVQPTAPLLRPATIDRAVRLLVESGAETVISVVNETHLAWTTGAEGRGVPLYEKRVNRQQLPQRLRETGGVFASRRDIVTPHNRIGQDVRLLELDRLEGLDIDAVEDWWIAEKALNRRKIVFRVDGSPWMGLGHVYRALSLAGRLLDHELLFVMDADLPLGVDLVRGAFYPVQAFTGDPLPAIREAGAQIVVNDILDTEVAYIRALRDMGLFVVNFEDLGPGNHAAHLVINALYDPRFPEAHMVWGPPYADLRDEFATAPVKVVEPDVRRVLVTFGGADPADLTAKTLRVLGTMPGDFEIEVVLGLAYGPREDLRVQAAALGPRVTVAEQVRDMSRRMHAADLVITSAGRTVYEVAAIGTPCIVMSQNAREQRHLFALAENGFVNLGLGADVPDETLRDAVARLVGDYTQRQQMSARMLAADIRGGTGRIVRLMLERYRAFEAAILDTVTRRDV
ncbi:cytidylyltransferase domain-containing protein [Aggregatilinea lenta]|uniref:cytidylyltransferase domain-containing protein n=1 Tax=Aggregatilinea lenta TaxID=913108 RepID=UPI000E5AEB13|nr:NTP transferase domain-containing protein [Aggregatilinea lenta]